jgi:hypothetical protein
MMRSSATPNLERLAKQAAAPDGTGPAERAPRARWYRDSRVPQVSGITLAGQELSDLTTWLEFHDSTLSAVNHIYGCRGRS